MITSEYSKHVRSHSQDIYISPLSQKPKNSNIKNLFSVFVCNEEEKTQETFQPRPLDACHFNSESCLPHDLQQLKNQFFRAVQDIRNKQRTDNHVIPCDKNDIKHQPLMPPGEFLDKVLYKPIELGGKPSELANRIKSKLHNYLIINEDGVEKLHLLNLKAIFMIATQRDILREEILNVLNDLKLIKFIPEILLNESNVKYLVGCECDEISYNFVPDLNERALRKLICHIDWLFQINPQSDQFNGKTFLEATRKAVIIADIILLGITEDADPKTRHLECSKWSQMFDQLINEVFKPRIAEVIKQRYRFELQNRSL